MVKRKWNSKAKEFKYLMTKSMKFKSLTATILIQHYPANGVHGD